MRIIDFQPKKDRKRRGRSAVALALTVMAIGIALALFVWMQLRSPGESHFKRALQHLGGG